MEPNNSNRIRINAVGPESGDHTTITAEILSGELRAGLWVSFTTEEGMPVTAQVDALGSADAPVNVLREGQTGSVTLGVEALRLSEGVVLETSEDEVSAPAMLLTQVAPEARHDLTVPPDELVEIQSTIERGDTEEALEALRAYPTDPATYHVTRRLMAKAYLRAESDLHDPEQALELALEAYSMRGGSDPDVNETLAAALAENGDPKGGLRYLDRLYACAMDQDSRDYYAKLIRAHRERYRVSDCWEVLNPLGDVVFRTGDDSEILDRFNDGAFPDNSQVRTNRIGELQKVAEFVQTVEVVPVVALEPESDDSVEADVVSPTRGAGVWIGGGALIGANVGALTGLASGMPLVVSILAGTALGAGAGAQLRRRG